MQQSTFWILISRKINMWIAEILDWYTPFWRSNIATPLHPTPPSTPPLLPPLVFKAHHLLHWPFMVTTCCIFQESTKIKAYNIVMLITILKAKSTWPGKEINLHLILINFKFPSIYIFHNKNFKYFPWNIFHSQTIHFHEKKNVEKWWHWNIGYLLFCKCNHISPTVSKTCQYISHVKSSIPGP